jgi:hypothetical protein
MGALVGCWVTSTLVLPKVVRLGELGGSSLVQQAMGLKWSFLGLFTKGISFFFLD